MQNTGSRWLVAVAAVVGAAIAVRTCHREHEQRAWDAVRARLAAFPAPDAPGATAHAPLLGEPRPGSAEQHYWAAYEAFERADAGEVESGDGRLGNRDLSDEDPLPADVAARLEPFAPVLAELAAGAASDRIDFGAIRAAVGGSEDAHVLDGCLLGAMPIANVGVVAARRHLAEGSFARAVQCTADLLTLARDHLHVGFAINDLLGAGIATRCCRLWHDAALAALPADSQRRLAAALERFDRTVAPATDCLRVETPLMLARVLAEPAAVAARPPHFLAYLDAIERVPAPTAPWRQRERALAAAARCLPPPESPQLVAIERQRRAAVANVRMLRMALAHHLGEPMPRLDDPFGEGPFAVRDTDDGFVIASAGTATNDDEGEEPRERTVRRR